ncbi:hypothetical protein [Natrinema pallidum]|uniref:Uncharacterized protein n=1 Tax=Natrinema pallidum TaxID=69527 RepID=A0A4V1IFK4_9EURY|nr:hypothetical protein [Natrinema pallidum]QCW05304.1 hypothetical protein FGF80_18865 [Natrinema pallidum]
MVSETQIERGRKMRERIYATITQLTAAGETDAAGGGVPMARLTDDLGATRGQINTHLQTLRDQGKVEKIYGRGRPAEDRPPVVRASYRPADDPEIVTDGGVTVFENGTATTCPDCGGELEYQTRVAVTCKHCDTQFDHFYSATEHQLCTLAEDGQSLETVATAPTDDEREVRADGPGQPEDETDLPEGWPVWFTDADPHCSHYYQWGDSRDAYKCIYCEHIRQEPPERKVDTTTDRSNGGDA